MKRVGGGVLLVAALLAAVPAWADMEHRWVVLWSEPDEYIGGGLAQTFGGFDNPISVSGPSGGGIGVAFDEPAGHWTLGFQAPYGDTLAVGEYVGGVNVSAPGRSCSSTDGWFEVLSLQPIAIDFKHHCNGSPQALYGTVRISADPVPPRPYQAVVGRDRSGYPGDLVTLDGRLSWSWNGDPSDPKPLSYSWTQTAGPAVTLQNASTALAKFVVPPLPPGGAEYEFMLTITDTLSRTDTGQVRVRAPSKSDPQNYVYVSSEPGDPVGNGKQMRLLKPDGLVTAALSDSRTVSFASTDSGHYAGGFLQSPVDTTLGVGVYEGAVSFPSSGAQPALVAYVDFSGCSPVTGRFEILELVRSPSGSLDSFAANFEQHCNGVEAALFGEIRHNYVESKPQPGAIDPCLLVVLLLGAVRRWRARSVRRA